MLPCNRHRGELDTRLHECGYGSDAAMFACFFCRDESADSKHAGAILCSSCGCPIGAHRDGPAAAGEGEGGSASVVIGTAVNPTADDSAVDGMRPVGGDDADAAVPSIAAPQLPTGVVAKSHYDELYFDGSQWKVSFYVGLVCLLIVFPASLTLMLLGLNSDDDGFGFAGFFVGQLLLVFSLTLGITFVALAPLSKIHTLRFGRVRAGGTADDFLARTIAYDGTSACCKAVCGCDELEFKNLTAKDVKSVQLHYSTTDSTNVSEANIALQFFADRLHVPVFEGKTSDPHAIAQAWRVFLRPDAPDRLGHVEDVP